MRERFWILLVATLVLVTLGASVVRAAEPMLQLPGDLKVSQTYIDALTYWYKYYFPQDWTTRLSLALTPEPDWDQLQANETNPKKAPEWIINNPEGERVIFTGVPVNAWWIDAWRLELDGSWTQTPAWHPSTQLPGPVSGDLMIQGKLPGVYVIRVCDRTGAVLAGGPKLIVVSWTNGTGGTWAQIFDVPSLPAATSEQLANIKM